MCLKLILFIIFKLTDHKCSHIELDFSYPKERSMEQLSVCISLCVLISETL